MAAMGDTVRPWMDRLTANASPPGVLIGQGPRAPSPMTFALEPDTFVSRVCRETLAGGQHTIFADGIITEGSAESLQRLATARGVAWARIVFNSPGGSLMGGLKLGETIRDLGFDTEVGHGEHTFESPRAGVCASACAYAFAGGVNRYFASPNQLGVHQFYDRGRSGTLAEGQAISGRIVSYLSKMGVDASAFAVATMAEPNQMLWLTEAEATRYRLANNGVHPTTAEIRLCEGRPYLRLEQTRREVTSRVLLMSADGKLELAAGIVTDPETTRLKALGVTRSYLEIDFAEIAPIAGRGGVSPEDSVLWIRRRLTPDLIAKLLTANDLDIWTENGGAFRWGAQMNVFAVRDRICDFLGHFAPGS